MNKIDLIIDALLVAPPSVWSARMNEALFVARELKAELENRQWVGLTDEEIDKCDRNSIPGADSLFGRRFYKALEAKLKERNV